MIHEAEHNPQPENPHPIKAERTGDEIERLIDEAATMFAKLFLEQVLDSRRKNSTSDADSGSHSETRI